jgi:hypothetical protein
MANMDSFAHRDAGPAAGEHDPLSAAQRADLRWGLERMLLEQTRDVDTTRSRDLARTLQRALRHLPVVMLHDRSLPGGLLAEHLAVGPGGVTVVAGWRLAEVVQPLAVERLRGIFGARAELLRDGAAADRTALVEPLRERAVAVRAVLDGYAPVAAALCLDGEESVERLRPLFVEGVLIAGPKAVAELVAREGDLQDYELSALVELLDAALPPAFGR